MEMDLALLNVSGKTDKDLEIDLLINGRSMGCSTMLKSDTLQSFSMEIDQVLLEQSIQELELVFNGSAGTRVVLDSIEFCDLQKPSDPMSSIF